MNKVLKKILIALFALVILVCVLLVLLTWSLKISPPIVSKAETTTNLKLTKIGNTTYFGNSWLTQQQQGIWQLYVEGEGYEMGFANGILTKQLNQQQEAFFVKEINNKVPSKVYQWVLKVFVGWFNRNINDYIPLEYRKEIYGISQFASSKFDYIASPYQRLINYHAAHDIGHALQNMHLVACTAVGAWGEYATDSSMYVGRNFDFYVGDDFAKEKIIAFVNPTHGNSFMSVTWGGMIGVLSGMNDKGLTVTLNADKSEIPDNSGTPVSIIARDILQYASTIDDAFAIAKKYQSFVSESFMIASAIDKKIAVIEKTPNKTFIYYPTENRIVCANHYQSDSLKGTNSNLENIQDSTSSYRQQRVVQLLNAVPRHDQNTIASLLRNQNGMNGKPIGMGNPKAINQLIAHHSIIFNPYKKEVWVSTAPYQLGKYNYYNLDSIFANPIAKPALDTKNIAPDNFLYSTDYKKFQAFKIESKRILAYIKGESNYFQMDPEKIEAFKNLNPNYFYTYEILGDYFNKNKNSGSAKSYYLQALQHDMPSETDRSNLKSKIANLNQK